MDLGKNVGCRTFPCVAARVHADLIGLDICPPPSHISSSNAPTMSRAARLWTDDAEKRDVEFQFDTFDELQSQLSNFCTQQGIGPHLLLLRGSKKRLSSTSLPAKLDPVDVHLRKKGLQPGEPLPLEVVGPLSACCDDVRQPSASETCFTGARHQQGAVRSVRALGLMLMHRRRKDLKLGCRRCCRVSVSP